MSFWEHYHCPYIYGITTTNSLAHIFSVIPSHTTHFSRSFLEHISWVMSYFMYSLLFLLHILVAINSHITCISVSFHAYYCFILNQTIRIADHIPFFESPTRMFAMFQQSSLNTIAAHNSVSPRWAPWRMDNEMCHCKVRNPLMTAHAKWQYLLTIIVSLSPTPVPSLHADEAWKTHEIVSQSRKASQRCAFNKDVQSL